MKYIEVTLTVMFALKSNDTLWLDGAHNNIDNANDIQGEEID